MSPSIVMCFQVVAIYTFDSMVLELVVTLSEDHPLSPVEVILMDSLVTLHV
jgi:hypothetical protein